MDIACTGLSEFFYVMHKLQRMVILKNLEKVAMLTGVTAG
jgi:hypothetical protein